MLVTFCILYCTSSSIPQYPGFRIQAGFRKYQVMLRIDFGIQIIGHWLCKTCKYPLLSHRKESPCYQFTLKTSASRGSKTVYRFVLRQRILWILKTCCIQYNSFWYTAQLQLHRVQISTISPLPSQAHYAIDMYILDRSSLSFILTQSILSILSSTESYQQSEIWMCKW